MSQTKECPKCHKLMLLRRTGECKTSFPAQYPTRWLCGCGYEEAGPLERDKTERELFMEEWERVNASR